jgi:hypothetical protein
MTSTITVFLPGTVRLSNVRTFKLQIGSTLSNVFQFRVNISATIKSNLELTMPTYDWLFTCTYMYMYNRKVARVTILLPVCCTRQVRRVLPVPCQLPKVRNSNQFFFDKFPSPIRTSCCLLAPLYIVIRYQLKTCFFCSDVMHKVSWNWSKNLIFLNSPLPSFSLVIFVKNNKYFSFLIKKFRQTKCKFKKVDVQSFSVPFLGQVCIKC